MMNSSQVIDPLLMAGHTNVVLKVSPRRQCLYRSTMYMTLCYCDYRRYSTCRFQIVHPSIYVESDHKGP